MRVPSWGRRGTASPISGASGRRSRGHGPSGSTSGRPRSPSAGSSRRASSAPTAAAWTSASGAAGSSASAAGPSTASTAGGSGRRASTAGRRTRSRDRLTRPLVRREGQAATRRRWDEAMGLIVDRSKEISRPAHGRRDRLLHERPALPRGVLHARRHRQGGDRDAAHGRQHPPLHRDRRGGAEGDLRRRRPARLVRRHRHHRRHPPRRPQRRRAADRALDAHPRPPPRPEPAQAHRDRPQAHGDGQGGRRPPRPARRHERRRAERPAEPRSSSRAASTAAYIEAHTVGFDALARDGRGAGRPARVEEIAGVPAATLRAAARILGAVPVARLDGPPGRLPVDAGDRRRVPGEQPAPDPRHASAGRAAASSR